MIKILFPFLSPRLVIGTNTFAIAGIENEGMPLLAINKTLMLELVNNARKKGCNCGNTFYPSAPAVSWNVGLEKAAIEHSSDMYSKAYFSHTGQDGTGAGVRIDIAGYKWRTYGENIAMGFSSEKAVMDGWLKSPGHCKNIMNPAFKEVGVAKSGSYWTQDFGTK